MAFELEILNAEKYSKSESHIHQAEQFITNFIPYQLVYLY
jgi:hypothetical protein